MFNSIAAATIAAPIPLTQGHPVYKLVSRAPPDKKIAWITDELTLQGLRESERPIGIWLGKGAEHSSVSPPEPIPEGLLTKLPSRSEKVSDKGLKRDQQILSMSTLIHVRLLTLGIALPSRSSTFISQGKTRQRQILAKLSFREAAGRLNRLITL